MIWQKGFIRRLPIYWNNLMMGRLFQPCGTSVWQGTDIPEVLVALVGRKVGEEEPREPASDQGSTLASPSRLLSSSEFSPQKSYFASFFSASCRWDLVPDQKAHGGVGEGGGRALAPGRGSAPRRCAARCSHTRWWTLSQSLFWKKESSEFWKRWDQIPVVWEALRPVSLNTHLLHVDSLIVTMRGNPLKKS